MEATATTRCHRHGWLDTLAVGASVVCAVHCLVTPVLLVALPVLATTFWVDANFHLWMLGLVVPTSAVAVFLGCRKHKDKVVVGLCAAGLAILAGMALYESSVHAAYASEVTPVVGEAGGEPGDAAAAPAGDQAGGGCAVCAGCATGIQPTTGANDAADGGPTPSARPVLTANAMVNVLGGLLLVLAHGRNFWLCRSASCRHD
ncbi:MAG: MerC domain-containing protein [Planctomycetota bacterium]